MSIEWEITENKDDDILFAEEESEVFQTQKSTWKIMIVDDDEDIHFLTKLVLRDFTFKNRNLSFISAYSGEEAKEKITQHPDTALIILDVIMEDPAAGFEVARYIREDIKNDIVRIILRTGQPGQEPQHQVVDKYDIDDYKTKTELSSQRLYTTIISALRSFRNITIIEKCYNVIQLLLGCIDNSAGKNSKAEYFRMFNTLLSSLLDLEDSFIFLHQIKEESGDETNDCEVIAVSGEYNMFSGKIPIKKLPPEITEILKKVQDKDDYKGEGNFYVEQHINNGHEFLFLFKGKKYLDDRNKHLISLLIRKLASSFIT